MQRHSSEKTQTLESFRAPRPGASRLRPGVSRLWSVIELLRPIHWIKNGFVLAPLLFAFPELAGEAIEAGMAAVVAFCFASSAVYIINDAADRERDRLHPQKRRRPLASGAVGMGTAAAVGSGCAAAAAALCLALPWRVGALIAGYAALNIAYSLALKRFVLIDVIAIAAGFILRILAGGAAAGVAPSPWMLHTAFFLSLFLGFTKRLNELLAVDPEGRRHVMRRYSRGFLTLMVGMFVSLTIMTYSLYVFFPRRTPASVGGGLVYTVPLVVYGLLRYLYLAMQRRAGGDIAEAVTHDVPLTVCIGLWVIAVVIIVGLRV